MVVEQPVDRQIVAQAAVIDDADPANGSYIIHLMLGKLIDRFVRCDAIFIQTARLRVRIMDDNLVTMHRQAMRTGKPGRTSTDDGNGLAGICRRFVELQVILHRMIGGVALQQTDLYRLAFCRFPNAGLFAQRFCGTDTRAHAAQNILVKDRAGGPFDIARGNLPDEFRNIDGRRTGRHAGRVIAEIAPVCRHQRFMRVQWRMCIREILFIDIIVQTAFDHPVFKISVDHACLRQKKMTTLARKIPAHRRY